MFRYTINTENKYVTSIQSEYKEHKALFIVPMPVADEYFLTKTVIRFPGHILREDMYRLHENRQN